MTNTSDEHAKPSILVVTQLYPNVVTSFLGTFVSRQLQHLKDRYNIVVLTTHYISLTKRHVLRQPRYEFRDGIHVYSVPHVAYWLFALPLISRRFRNFVLADKLLTARKIRKMARELHMKHNFSLVHGHETYIGDEAAPIARMLGVPSVFTLHSLYWYHVQFFGKAVVRRAIANMNATDGLIAVSRLSAESYRERGVRPSFHIIPNGADLPPLGSSHSEVPEDIMAFVRGKFVLLAVGFLVAEKRVEQSIMTLARLHRSGIENTVLLIIGKGRLKGQLRRLIRHEKVGNAVKLVGEVPPTDMPYYYAAADVLVHPSIVESCPMVCLEAMSCGKPIICTSSIGLVDYLHPGTDGIVIPPDDNEALYQAVLGLIQDPLRRRMLGEQAQRTAADLTWSDQVRKIERLYEQVLSE